MSDKDYLLGSLSYDQFELAPSQVWGNIRLVPVIKRAQTGSLRLGTRHYEQPSAIVALDGKDPLRDTEEVYYSYIPHAMVARWSNDNKPVVPYGCQIESKKRGLDNCVRVDYRMAKRESEQQMRFLPLHLAMEGFLSLCFGGPSVAWSEYSHSALRHGLGSRSERSIRGHQIAGLADALRVFEIHDYQVGVIVFVSDVHASTFIVSHPDDYRLMHESLLEDFYGEILYYYGQQFYDAPLLDIDENGSDICSLEDLNKIVESVRSNWRAQQLDLMRNMTDRSIESKIVGRVGPYRLQRFTTDFDNEKDNYIGEAITSKKGEIAYLKTYQLSRTQSKRAYLLSTLSKNLWNLENTAASLDCSKNSLITRLHNAGFGYLLKPHVLEAALKENR